MSRKRLFAAVLAGLALLATMITTNAGPAQAAVPDRKGWVLWNQAGPAVVPFGTWPPATTVVQPALGRYRVTFPGQAAPGGVVHVTAINTAPRWCQVDSWGVVGADEIANVSCRAPGGALAQTSFSAVFYSSSGGPAAGPYGYVYSTAAGAVVNQYNSAAGINTVFPGPVGVYLVRFPGIVTGGPLDGSVQVTSVLASAAARCKVGGWSSTALGQDVTVRCFNAAGAPVNTAFTVTYQHKVSLYGASSPPFRFGYVLFQPGVGPPTTNYNNGLLAFGANTVGGGGGLFIVTFPAIGVPQNTVQVSAYGPSPDFCGMNVPWLNAGGAPPQLIVRDVNCFTNAGAPVTTGFTVSASSIA
ncbi:hypothetical protein F4553_001414 [Allocatelliglobosispora scoriae]|uniref:Uncharacterized protein n=1 Tax=Allocatelliglobosispora scoriae TaxID=643052 RepID=A0A841BK68_9ACTN|nr:hypothetical protein [Allocatelliglobosispora scoriae]MBB5868035.1 hypothetical protein [Allocatelliglobosispora scoriae]